MWPAAAAADTFARGDRRRRRRIEQRTLRLYGIPESEIAETLRAAEAAGPGLDGLEITTCLRRGELEVVTRYEPAAEAAYAGVRGGRPRAPRRHAVLDRRLDGRRAGRRAAALPRLDDRDGRVVHGRAARRPPDGPGGLVGLRAGRPRRVLERGEDGARGRPGGSDRAGRRGVGRGRRGARRRRAGARRRRRRGRDHRRRRPGRRDGDEAGRPRLLLGRRAGRARGSPARRGCPAGAPTCATARRRSRCTSSGGSCADETDDASVLL